MIITDVHFFFWGGGGGGVEAGAPHVQEGEGTGVPKEKEKIKAVKERQLPHEAPARGNEYPGKKSRLLHNCH